MSHETEQMLQCPYNPSHMILRYRMQTHLHKCRKQHLSLQWESCCHNQTHQMPKEEIKWHENHACPDRHSFFAKQTQFATPAPSLAPVLHIDLPEPEENWDDGQVNYFNPAENARQKCLIRGIHCVPPSERKEFKSQHRRHVQHNGEEIATSARLMKTQLKENNLSRHQEASTVRAPKEPPKGLITPRGGNMCQDDVKTHGILSSPPPPQPQVVPRTGYGRGRVFSSPDAVSAPAAPQELVGAWGREGLKF